MEMSPSMSKKILSKGLSSSLRKEEEIMLLQKQGIVTILGSNCESNIAAATSLRRTLSADMSSKKWLSQNGLFPMKRIASSVELTSTNADTLPSSEGEDDYEEMKKRDQIWSSIQQDKKEQHQKTEHFDIWSSILPQKTKEETTNSLAISPYIHPLVKRSKNCLSPKSLEICTESLGSETGSDGFSSDSAEHSDEDKKEENEQEQLQQAEEVTVQTHDEEELQNLQMPKYNSASNKSKHSSFPPPLSSVHMLMSHRDNGRLFLEAVIVPSQNNFCAKRQDGRLVLTFASEEESEVGEEKDHLEEDEEKNEIGDVENVIEQATMLFSEITSFHKLALVMNKPKWSEKFNESLLTRLARLIPSTTVVASASASATVAVASFSAYEHYLKTNSTAKAAPIHKLYQQNDYLFLNKSSSNLFVSRDTKQTSNDQQQLLVLRGKNGDYLVHNLKSCKDSRRSFMFWEPYCIAT